MSDLMAKAQRAERFLDTVLTEEERRELYEILEIPPEFQGSTLSAGTLIARKGVR